LMDVEFSEALIKHFLGMPTTLEDARFVLGPDVYNGLIKLRYHFL
jgi:hypothetical protein